MDDDVVDIVESEVPEMQFLSKEDVLEGFETIRNYPYDDEDEF